MGFPVLNVDDPDDLVRRDDDRNRKEGLVLVFGQVVEDLEAGVLARVSRNRHGFRRLSNPTRDPLTDLYADSPDQTGMRVLRGTKKQIRFAVFQEVQEAGIALRDGHNQLDDLLENLVQVKATADRPTDLVKDFEFLARQVQGFAHVAY